MSAPHVEATCSRCPHPLAEHGAGCTSGWIQPGPECHCPNDYDGNNAQSCARIGCNATGTHVARWGQFFCPEHPEPGTLALDEVTSWVAA